MFKNHILTLLAFFIIILQPIILYAKQAIDIEVIHIQDGDSITVLTKDKQKLKIRLDAIDAPELSQPFGQQSKAYLSKLLRDSKNITLIKKGKDTYGRTLGTIYVNDVDINAKMVADGFAWSYRAKFNPDSRLGLLERDARNNKFGIWADSRTPTPPWEYRKNEREGNYEASKPLVKSPIEGLAVCINMKTNEISYYVGRCPPKHKALIK